MITAEQLSKCSKLSPWHFARLNHPPQAGSTIIAILQTADEAFEAIQKCKSPDHFVYAAAT